MRTFQEYYEFYLTLHQNKWCRRLHVIGQLITILYVTFCVLSSQWLLLILAPFVVYPFAWSGHLFFEKNKPLAWEGKKDYGWTTLKAKVCDWIMLKDILLGKIKW